MRTLKPVPQTTNGQYGWVLSKSDFKLDIYGPELYKPKPFLLE